MKQWQGPVWGAGGAGLLAVALYGAGLLGSGSAPRSGRTEAEQGQTDQRQAQIGIVTLDNATRQRLGIAVAPLTSGSDSPALDGFARGLDVAPLAAILAEVDSAGAAAEASTAEAERLDSLYRQDASASQRSVEASRAQARVDGTRVRLAQQRIGLEFGSGIARLGLAGVRRLIAEIAAGQAALVRIDIPGASLAPGSSVRVGSAGISLPALVLGPAASADARLQSAGALAVLRGSLARQALAGRMMPASVTTGTGRAGVLVPRDAIVRFQGQMWVYRDDGQSLVRVALVDPVSLADGWLIPSRPGAAVLQLGDLVAVKGATGLLAIDLAASGQSQSAAEED